MVDRTNLLVKTFKQANPNLIHEKAQKRVKEYYDMIKNKPDVEKLVKIGKFGRKPTYTYQRVVYKL